jgi:hypothetical protein
MNTKTAGYSTRPFSISPGSIGFLVVTPVGLEPTTNGLKVRCSTIELQSRAPIAADGPSYPVSGVITKQDHLVWRLLLVSHGSAALGVGRGADDEKHDQSASERQR